MVDVGQKKQIRVNWKFFSLKIINKDRETPEDYKILHEIGLKALRVAAAVRRQFGNDGVDKIYTAMGAIYHHDEGDIDDTPMMEEILQRCGLPSGLGRSKWRRRWWSIVRLKRWRFLKILPDPRSNNHNKKGYRIKKIR